MGVTTNLYSPAGKTYVPPRPETVRNPVSAGWRFRAAAAEIVRAVARGIKTRLEPANLPGTVFSLACVYSSTLGFRAAMADPLLTMKIVGGLGSTVGALSSTFLLFSARGSKSPYEGSVWKTMKKAAVSPNTSTDYFMRSWSFPMAVINHTTQLVDAVAFGRVDQAFSFLIGLPGEVLGFTGIYRQARHTKAVEEGRASPSITARETTLLGKMRARATETIVSPFGSYLCGRAIDYFNWMDANSLHNRQCITIKHHAIEFGLALATVGIAFWKIQKDKGLGISYRRSASELSGRLYRCLSAEMAHTFYPINPLALPVDLPVAARHAWPPMRAANINAVHGHGGSRVMKSHHHALRFNGRLAKSRQIAFIHVNST